LLRRRDDTDHHRVLERPDQNSSSDLSFLLQVKSSDIAPPDEFALGASLLIEAIEAIDHETLLRVWRPYSEWRIGFRNDPEIDHTVLGQHLNGHPERLRRLMRLAVSGTITLEPPPKSPITEALNRICAAAESQKWHEVLGVESNAAPHEVKRSFRALALRFHPDKWESHPDPRMRDHAEHAFCHLNRAQREMNRPKPIAPISEPAQGRRTPFWRWVLSR
jgi:hypothetical protein